MTTKKIKKIPSYGTSKISDVINRFYESNYIIPNFQRDYVWEIERVKNFLNSIILIIQ